MDYLAVKRHKLGHLLDPEPVAPETPAPTTRRSDGGG
jgi:hypothetical protein